MLGLHCCARAFDSCSQRGVFGFRAQALGARGLQSTGSGVEQEFICSMACGIFPDQGLNWCFLHCKADCSHWTTQGSPVCFFFLKSLFSYLSFPSGSVVKNSPANAGDIGDAGSIPSLGRSPEEGNCNLSNILAGEIPWATVHGVSKSRTRLSDLARTSV